MNYKDLYKAALTGGTVRSVEPDFVRLNTPGDMLVGRLVEIIPTRAKQGGGTFNCYTFETDAGYFKTKCGAATDNKIKAVLRIGGIYAVTFLGQTDLGNNTKVNDFRWEEIPEPEVPYNGEEVHTVASAVQEP